MADKEFEGKDLKQVLENASAKLGIAEPDLDYEIIEPGRRGLFGVGAKSIRIRVMPPIDADQLLGVPQPKRQAPPQQARQARQETKERPRRSRRPKRGGGAKSAGGPREPRKERKAGPPTPSPDAEVTSIGETVSKMLELTELELTATSVVSDSGTMVELSGPDTKLLVERDGALMSAIQFLLNRMARRTWPGTNRIQVSCEGHKKERDDDLVERTRAAAEQVLESGEPRRLPEMNAYERRLVHITVREYEALGSRSEGNGHQKRVRIYKSKKAED
jgi:spoIIIJ-associated protein